MPSSQDDGQSPDLASARTQASDERLATSDTMAGDDAAIGSSETLAGDSAVASSETMPSDAAVASATTLASDAAVGSSETVPNGSAAASAETAVSGKEAAAERRRPPQQEAPARYRSGERFGSFEVLRQLGAGGMGVVFAARDPDLDRNVAIKVLHAQLSAPDIQVRLLREAQAMAQLSHPHVITVHQVGTHDERVFVVMEYVDGGTLRQWLSAEPRTWREILAAYLDAGQGLAAAHRAGLVHRDFKPDNVLIRSDGRVLVTDFGLVATMGGATVGEVMSVDAVDPVQALPLSTPSKLALQLTRTGDVMGTPLYMAPEQHKGERADARADQFAFCVSLFEALYGQRPFDGKSYREVFASVMQGKPSAAPDKTKVPPWVYDVLVRGLRTDPAERYPDIETLLDALAHDPSAARRRRRKSIGAVAGLLAMVGLLVVLWPDSGAVRCQAAGDRLDDVWNNGRRVALRQAWSTAREQVERIIAAFDAYGTAWAHERVSACEATYVQGEQSELLLDRRMFCLDRRLGEMGALVQRLEQTGSQVGSKAVNAVGHLTRFDECRDRETLAEVAAPPAAIRQQADDVASQLDRAAARRSLGELQPALVLAEKALQRAQQLGYAPLLARAHYLVGFVSGQLGKYAPAEQHYREAIRQAARAKAHHQEATAWLSLVYLVGHTTDRPEPALAMAPAAEAAVARAAGDASLRGRLQGNLGLILMTKGDYRAARAKLEQALQTFERAYGGDDLDTAIARNNLAMLLEKLGEAENAYQQLQRVLSVRQKVLGPQHPAVATVLNDLGNAAQAMGQPGKARLHLQRALAIREAALGPDHQRTAHVLNNLAIVTGELGDSAQALKHAQRAVAIVERAFHKNHPELAGPLNTVGNQLRASGQHKAAWEAFARALAIIEYAKGREHIAVVPMLENLARLLSELGDVDRALQFVDRAIAVRQRIQGQTHPLTIDAVALRGSLQLQAKRAVGALADFERQLALATRAHGETHAEVASAQYNLAMAHENNGAYGQAEARYRKALDIFQAAAPDHPRVVHAWRGRGDVAVARRDLEAAQQHYQQAVTMAERLGHGARADVMHLLGGVYAQRGSWPEASDLFARTAKARREAGEPVLAALAEFEQAKALWAGRVNRARSVEIARQARKTFVGAGPRAEDNVAEVDAWLRQRTRY